MYFLSFLIPGIYAYIPLSYLLSSEFGIHSRGRVGWGWMSRETMWNSSPQHTSVCFKILQADEVMELLTWQPPSDYITTFLDFNKIQLMNNYFVLVFLIPKRGITFMKKYCLSSSFKWVKYFCMYSSLSVSFILCVCVCIYIYISPHTHNTCWTKLCTNILCDYTLCYIQLINHFFHISIWRL